MIFFKRKHAKHFSDTGGKMHSPTYDELVNQISLESDKIAAIFNSMRDTLNKWQVIPRLLYVIYISKRLLNKLDKIEEAGCIKCPGSQCSYKKDFATKLSSVVGYMHIMIERNRKFGYPNLILNLQQNLIYDFEDKVENFTLASDIEVEQLALNIADRINKGHGIHANKAS